MAMYWLWPKEEVITQSGRRGYKLDQTHWYFNDINIYSLAKNLGVQSSMEKDKIEALLLELYSENDSWGYIIPNYFEEKIILEDSPGNFLIKIKDGKPFVCVYDTIGSEKWIEITQDRNYSR